MSVVQIYGLNSSNHCGYCGQSGSSSYGMSCSKMKASDYESLMLLGWRRSGSYYYKPHLPASCCKLNTIRLDVGKFQANKHQRKVMKKFNGFLDGKTTKQVDKSAKRQENKAILDSQVSKEVLDAVELSMSLSCSEYSLEPNPSFVKVQRNSGDRISRFGTYTCSTALMLAGVMKKTNPESTVSAQILAEKMRIQLQSTFPHFGFSVSPQGHLNLTDPSADPILQPVSEPANPSVPLVPKQYTLTIVDSDFTEEAYQLYKKYQISVHHDSPGKVTRDQYTSFLCDSSLIKDKVSPEGPGIGYGTYHFHHRLDGKLFAVGVCDILPTGLSSVYFFYDTDLSFLTIGTFGAVKEIEWILQRNSPLFRYYYMGFYIDTCVKMRYKGEFFPSELLCPQTYNWVPLNACLPSKSQHGFLHLSPCALETRDLPIAEDMNIAALPNVQEFLVSNVMVVIKGKLMKLQTVANPAKMRIVLYLQDAIVFLGKTMIERLLFAF